MIKSSALIGNLENVALVREDGGINWLCFARLDSLAQFVALLGTEEHSFWRIGPSLSDGLGPASADRRWYQGDSLILVSEWDTPSGTARVLDFMTMSDGVSRLIRIVEGVRGRVAMCSRLRARTGDGRLTPQVCDTGSQVNMNSGDGSVWLDSDVFSDVDGSDIRSDFTVSPGERIVFTLNWKSADVVSPLLATPVAALKSAADFWHTWSARCAYRGLFRNAVMRSLITLKALTHEPSGEIVPMPPASLPKDVDGVQSRDYPSCWLRAGAGAVSAFLRAGYVDEAVAWIRWLMRVTDGDTDRYQIMNGLDGDLDLREKESSWLSGNVGYSSVSVEGGASKQLQLDVFGDVVEALHEARLRYPNLGPLVAPFQVNLVTRLEQIWDQPDEGIWEVRGPRRHFTHSKVMAWVAVDRTIKLIESGDADGPLERWRELRNEIHRDVCEKGYDKERNTFTQSYGSKELDASVLHIALSGFLPSDDERVVGTIEAIQRDLSRKDGALLSYRSVKDASGIDGCPEGAFLVCTGWLVKALVRIGRLDEARALFDLLLSVNGVGLLAEEGDADAGRHISKIPWAFRHLSVSDAAHELSEALANVSGFGDTEAAMTL
ncbi:glycoside hydrolase family 15 protein [Streptomyces sp. NPDC056549]|uniref:glycoside hydrolase family 15 protein n=1 Tax=Streptomyces sp. NPDC056549 TaxID=3345864 RepID=UPI0036C0889E